MNKAKFVPRYQSIYEDLRQQIEDKVFAPGDQLPFERALCERYGVQRVTVRKALEMLSESGLIEKRAGRGSFVRQEAAQESAPPSRTILFLMRKNQNDIKSNSSAFNAQLFFPMERVCGEHGYSLLYAGLGLEDSCEALIKRHNVAGIYLVSTLDEGVYDTVARLGVPALCLNHWDERFLSVLPDNDSGVRAAMGRLLDLGHARIAFVRGMAGAINAKERYDSYRLALLERDLPLIPAYVLDGEWTFEGGKTAMDALLTRLPPERWPTAVVAASDMMAIGCMEAIQKRGLSVPGDVSVVGFDDIDLCKFCAPQLTTVLTDTGLMTRIAFDHLSRRFDAKGPAEDPVIIRLPSKLVERQSVAAPKA